MCKLFFKLLRYSKSIIVLSLILAVWSVNLSYSQTNDTLMTYKSSYDFIIKDSPARLFTMRQFNKNYLSLYRYTSHLLSDSPKSSHRWAMLALNITDALFLYPLTHEEGHRSILSSLGIGSISQPYFNSKGAAYAMGVKDDELIKLRTNDLPNYIRLHTAGLESDYMLCRNIEDAVIFGKERKSILFYSYLLRQLGIISYYGMSAFPNMMPQIAEESDEYKRDIVGIDVYGAVKNLYRPNEIFYRYTNYNDLTRQEQKFVTRVATRSLLNIINPLFIKPLNFIQKENLKLSLGVGYTMSPFGDFIDENFWLKIHDQYNIKMYLRQFQNKTNWFFGGGISLVDYEISPIFKTTISTHLWSQPKNLDFNTSNGKFGGSGDILIKSNLIKMNSNQSLSIDLGLNYKTKGFLPEEMLMKEHIGLRIGMTFYFTKIASVQKN
ncbi:MAG: hypothetical protein GX102_10450 [Porphyromonadaceae bacterium]|nr:hypothetical protein [Porphyromonadaceae bacterium]